jgi:hypothetical protein
VDSAHHQELVARTFRENFAEWTLHVRAAFNFELIAMHRFTRPTMENEIIRSVLSAALASEMISPEGLGENAKALDEVAILVGKARHEDAEVWRAQAHWAFFQRIDEKRKAERKAEQDHWKVRNEAWQAKHDEGLAALAAE